MIQPVPAPGSRGRYTWTLATIIFILGVTWGGHVRSAPPSGAGLVVHLKDIEFHPARIKVSAGQKLKFINDDPFNHDVYIVDAANRNLVVVPTTLLKPGDSTIVEVKQKALFLVYCTIHGGMQAKLTTTGSFELTAAQKEQAAKAPVLPPIVKKGEKLFWGRAICHQCHRIGTRGDGLRGPDLQNVGFRAGPQAKRLGLKNGTAYLIQSVLEPDKYIVEGYSNDMPRLYMPPLDLELEDLKAVLTYLQSQGGKVDTWAINLPKEPFDRPAPYNPFKGGDPAKGEKLFAEDVGCQSCHQVADKPPVSVGPDLTNIGKFRPWEWLIQSILDPSDEVGANWTSVDLVLTSGEKRTG
ncbi:MAG: c-type cytochrome, partial [Acidobacteriota bacterium]